MKGDTAMKKTLDTRDTIADMTRSILADKEIMTEKVRNQIRKALEINCHLTSTYALQVEEVLDIKGHDSKTSGWYFILTGTRCGVNFFLNNEMEIVRKPDKRHCEVKYRYGLYNHRYFDESFWGDNF